MSFAADRGFLGPRPPCLHYSSYQISRSFSNLIKIGLLYHGEEQWRLTKSKWNSSIKQGLSNFERENPPLITSLIESGQFSVRIRSDTSSLSGANLGLDNPNKGMGAWHLYIAYKLRVLLRAISSSICLTETTINTKRCPTCRVIYFFSDSYT